MNNYRLLPHFMLVRKRIALIVMSSVVLGVILTANQPVMAQSLIGASSEATSLLAWVVWLWSASIVALALRYGVELFDTISLSESSTLTPSLKDGHLLVVDSVTFQPIAKAEMVCLRVDATSCFGGQTNKKGLLAVDELPEEVMAISIAKPGYYTVTLERSELPNHVFLTPLVTDTTQMLRTTFNQVTTTIGIASLVWGTLFLLIAAAQSDSPLFTSWITAYLLVWLSLLLFVRLKRMHARVIDGVSHNPIRFPRVSLRYPHKIVHCYGDNWGNVYLPVGVPESVTVLKQGYQPLLHASFPATAVTPETTTLSLVPHPASHAAASTRSHKKRKL